MTTSPIQFFHSINLANFYHVTIKHVQNVNTFLKQTLTHLLSLQMEPVAFGKVSFDLHPQDILWNKLSGGKRSSLIRLTQNNSHAIQSIGLSTTHQQSKRHHQVDFSRYSRSQDGQEEPLFQLATLTLSAKEQTLHWCS